jgi:hypothetical protein
MKRCSGLVARVLSTTSAGLAGQQRHTSQSAATGRTSRFAIVLGVLYTFANGIIFANPEDTESGKLDLVHRKDTPNDVPQVDSQPSEWSWNRTTTSVALVHGEAVVWQFNYGSDLDVPYIHPLGTVAGQLLSQDRPADHVWHHGLWFSWKFINGVNYWEINPQTGRPDGRTRWVNPLVETTDNRAAVISMQLSYVPAHEDAQAVLQERRRIEISAPDAQGQYQIDWTSRFTAVADRVVLDRVPPKEQAWGGYAGLSIRFRQHFADRSAVSSVGLA